MTATVPDPLDVPDLLRRVGTMLDRGRPIAARALMNGILHGGRHSVETAELQVRLLLAEKRPDEAHGLLDEAVATYPGSTRLLLLRGSERLRAGDAQRAAADAAEAMLLEPHLVRAKALLGVALLECGDHADARTCLAEVLVAEPTDPVYRQAAARAIHACERLQPCAALTMEWHCAPTTAACERRPCNCTSVIAACLTQ